MAKPHQRMFALVLALLFLLTSVGAGAAVLWQIKQDNDQTASVNDAEAPKEGQMQGKKLENFDPVTQVDKLQITDLTEGDGAEVKPGATVTAHYTGAYAVNGEIFESSHDGGQPATFPLDQVIPGWQQGVPGMKVGGKRRLIIPGNLAYGEAPDGYTPGSSGRPLGTLVFDIEMISVE